MDCVAISRGCILILCFWCLMRFVRCTVKLNVKIPRAICGSCLYVFIFSETRNTWWDQFLSLSSSNLKVRVHDNKEFKGSWPHLNLTPSRPVLGKPQHRARNELYRSMALKMEEHIRTTLMFLPLSSLGSLAEMVTLCHLYDSWSCILCIFVSFKLKHGKCMSLQGVQFSLVSDLLRFRFEDSSPGMFVQVITPTGRIWSVTCGTKVGKD